MEKTRVASLACLLLLLTGSVLSWRAFSDFRKIRAIRTLQKASHIPGRLPSNSVYDLRGDLAFPHGAPDSRTVMVLLQGASCRQDAHGWEELSKHHIAVAGVVADEACRAALLSAPRLSNIALIGYGTYEVMSALVRLKEEDSVAIYRRDGSFETTVKRPEIPSSLRLFIAGQAR